MGISQIAISASGNLMAHGSKETGRHRTLPTCRCQWRDNSDDDVPGPSRARRAGAGAGTGTGTGTESRKTMCRWRKPCWDASEEGRVVEESRRGEGGESMVGESLL